MNAKHFTEAYLKSTPLKPEDNIREIAHQVREAFASEYPDASVAAVDSFRRYVSDAPVVTGAIHYSTQHDVYTVNYPGRAPVEIEGARYRQIKADYSNWCGGASTINDIARDHNLSRDEFAFLRKQKGWTHGSSPFVEEELLDPARDVASFVEDLAALKERQIEKAFDKARRKAVEKKAEAYDALKAGTLDLLSDHVADNPARRAPLKLELEQLDYLAIFSPADLHIGKLGVNGYNVARARADVLASTDRLVARLAAKGLPAKTLLVLGNDWWHVDGPGGLTTAGTPQDVDGLPEATIPAGYETAVEVIDRLRLLGDVEVLVVPSNHSNWGDHHLVAALGLAYRSEPDVRIKSDIKPRQYIRFGVNLIGFEHGDGAKAKDLGPIMSRECPAAWGSAQYKYWVTGHLHHLKEVNEGGVHIMQAPSLGGDDRWHSKKGYVQSERGQVAYLFDRAEGHTTRELALVPGLHVEAVLDL